MVMVPPPDAGVITDTTSPAPAGGGVATATSWFEQLRNFVAQLAGAAVYASTTLASDTFTPSQAVHVLDTEAAAASDNLALIGQGSGVPDGWEIRIRCANAARVITVKHNTGGTGTIFLADAADLVLNDTTMWLDLERRGSAWYEIRRSYGGNKTAFTAFFNAATAALKGIVELATGTETITGSDANRAVTPDGLAALWEDGGDNANGATITLGEGGSFNLITSTTTITAIVFSTSKVGRKAIVRFNTIRTLTNGAGLALPGGANITTAVGDLCEVEDRGSSNARVNWYTRADGTPIVAPVTFIPRGFISPDFRFTNNAVTPNTKIDYSAGQITDSANAVLMASAGGTIDLTATGADGLDTGSLANATPYWLFIITNGTLVKGLASLSASSPTMPGGYTVKRRSGLFFTDASAHVIPWVWDAEGAYMLKDPTNLPLLSHTDTSSSDVLGPYTATTPLPTGAKIEAILRVGLISFTSASTYMIASVWDPDGSTPTMSHTATPLSDFMHGQPSGSATKIVGGGVKRAATNTSAQVKFDHRTSNGGGVDVRIALIGWRYNGL